MLVVWVSEPLVLSSHALLGSGYGLCDGDLYFMEGKNCNEI